jgi:hypothetical protein
MEQPERHGELGRTMTRMSWRQEAASGLPDDGGLGDHGGDDVRVHVGRRPAILEVALAVLLRLPADADRGAAVGNSPAEGVDVGGLVPAGEPALVALAVGGDVLLVPELELLNGGLDDLVATIVPHRLGAVVGVSTSTVPVSRDGLGVK